MGYITIQEHQIYYEIDGSGPPVLMVMGLGGNSQVWAPIRRTLTSNHTLIMYDMRGTGRSSMPTQPVTLDELMEEIQVLLTHLDLQNVHGVGFSFGATVLLSYARRFPHSLRSLSLVSGVYEITPYVQRYLEVQTALAQTLERGLYLKQIMLWLLSERFFRENPDFFERAIYMLTRSEFSGHFLEVWQLFYKAFQASYRELDVLDCPVQFIHGTADKVGAPEIVQHIAGLLKESQVNWVEHGAHMLTWDAPERTAELLLHFLSEH